MHSKYTQIFQLCYKKKLITPIFAKSLKKIYWTKLCNSTLKIPANKRVLANHSQWLSFRFRSGSFILWNNSVIKVSRILSRSCIIFLLIIKTLYKQMFQVSDKNRNIALARLVVENYALKHSPSSFYSLVQKIQPQKEGRKYFYNPFELDLTSLFRK